MDIVIQSFNGIGDLLFLTPSLSAINAAYPDARIVVNTNYPLLLLGNPYVDAVGNRREGVFLGYPDPIHHKRPTQHHILSDWEIVCRSYGLDTERPALKPELYFGMPDRGGRVRVQVMHKGQWHGKKVWHGFKRLAQKYGFDEIPRLPSVAALAHYIAESACVVCAEGAISHIAKAVGTPAVVIYGGFADPIWNGYEDQTNLTQTLECSPCYNPDPCRFKSKPCMEYISVEHVQAMVNRALTERREAAAA